MLTSIRLSIAAKIVICTILGVTFASASVMVTTFFLMRQASERQLGGMVRQSKTVIEEYYEILEANLAARNAGVAADADMLALLGAGDSAGLRVWGQAVMRDSNSDLCTITDDRGVVLARAHSEQKGDSLADQDMVRRALQGESVSGIVTSSLIPFSIRGCAPIRKDGRVIGTISLGVSIITEDFVDNLKRLSGLEMTFFQGDTRVMSTIANNGRRDIGSKLGNAQIEEFVLRRGLTEFRDLVIFGIPYKTAYWPVVDVDRQVVGMWSLALPVQEYVSERERALLLGLAAMIGITLFLICASIIFGKWLTRPIKDVTAFSKAIAEGDLEASFSTKANDEVGVLAGSMRHMVENMKARIAESEQKGREAAEQSRKTQEAMLEANAAKMTAEANHTAMMSAAEHLDQVVNRLFSATERLSAQIAQSSRSTEIQHDRLSQSAAAMEEMNSTVMEVARNAGVAAQGAETARTKAVNGAGIVQESVRSINTVQENTGKLRVNMEKLGQQAKSISTIMTVISDIADQTNLLALNAAIEAARAGEAGRGFAVVADEVRKLAEKTMSATKEVGAAIGGVQTGTTQSIAAAEQTTGNLSSTIELVKKSGEALTGIVEEVNTAAAQVSGIATAAEEQSATSEEIVRSLDEINRMADTNASTMRQSEQAVSELAQQTEELRALVYRLSGKSGKPGAA